MNSTDTEFGRLGMLICGDLFAEYVIARLDPALRLLLVPMARSFDVHSPDPSSDLRSQVAANQLLPGLP